MAAINADMANAWFFVAESMRKDPMPIFRVHDDTNKFLGLNYRNWGLGTFLLIIGYLIFKITSSNRTLEEKIIITMCLVPILVPYITTNAHENHFFYGFVSTIILGALLSDKMILYSGYLLGVLNGINVFYWMVMAPYFHIAYSNPPKMAIIGASSIIFFVLLYHLIFKIKSFTSIVLTYILLYKTTTTSVHCLFLSSSSITHNISICKKLITCVTASNGNCNRVTIKQFSIFIRTFYES